MAKQPTKTQLLDTITQLEAALVAARTQIEDLERICALKHERTQRAVPAPRPAYAAPAWQAQRAQAMQAARAQAMATGRVVLA